MYKIVYRVLTPSDDGDTEFDGELYHSSRNLHTESQAEALRKEWERTSPSFIQESSDGGKTWE